MSIQSSQMEIHNRFGKEYRVQERVAVTDIHKTASLFFHNSISYAYYDDPNFVPDWGLPPQLPEWAAHLRATMESVCSDSVPCQYDFVTTLDKDYAKITKEHEAQAHFLANEVGQRGMINFLLYKYQCYFFLVIRCPALPKPLNGRKSENRYWPGTIVRFSCDDGYRLVGYEARRCREDGLWSWGVDPECISKLI